MTPEEAASSGLGMTGEELASWPGMERRDPPLHDRHYLALAPLAEALREAVKERLRGRGGLDVLDVGCGAKPYLPLFAVHARSYRGIDMEPGPFVDDVGAAEDLPYAEASFDVVLCTQALEHLREPDRAVRELHRVLRPGGTALVSTHGVFLYHPDPPGSDRDYWRWTHAGLERLFNTAADWTDVEVKPNGEVLACLGNIVCQFVDEAGQRLGSPWARRTALRTINRLVRALDRRYPPRARVPAGGSLSANYLLCATKAATA